MDHKAKACTQSTKNCLLIHGKNKDPSSVGSSFFKVMIGDNYSNVLYVPPRFARALSDLVNQKIHLEDSSGQLWKVKLSYHEDSLAFLEGWPAFSQDHGLEVGDFLAFYYITVSHFIVHIWGKSGCEKLNYSEKNGNKKKKTRTNRNSAARDGQCHKFDKNSMNRQGSSTSAVQGSCVERSQRQPIASHSISNFSGGNGSRQPVSANKYTEEPFYMIDRDTGYEQGEDRTCLFDLSNFEMQTPRSVADRTNKVPDCDESPYHADTMLKSPSNAGLVDIRKESFSPPDAAHCATTRKTNNPGMSEFNNSPISISVLKRNFGGMTKMIKPEQVETPGKVYGREKLLHGKECGQSSSSGVKDNDKVNIVVKAEPVDSLDLFPSAVGNFSCSVVITSQAFLELQTQLPSVSFRRRRRDLKLVYLQDQDGRLWPVLYEQKYGHKVLTTGWNAFCKANNIQQGDKCVFVLETRFEGNFSVSIVRT